MLRFGPAGTPIQCEKDSTFEGIKCAKSLGLDAYEIEFVRGVRMKEDSAYSISKLVKDLDIVISSHAPYYINLATLEKEKAERSKNHIISSSRITELAGGWITVVHPGYYQKLSKKEAYSLVKKRLEEILEVLSQENIKTKIGIETMGKLSSFGKLEEVLSLYQDLERIYPVIDFAHLRALNIYKFTETDHYVKVFEMFGEEIEKNFHVHFSEIEFTEKGEKRHLPLETNNEPDYKAFIRACVENGFSGSVICESPKIDIDAQLMKKYYEEIK